MYLHMPLGIAEVETIIATRHAAGVIVIEDTAGGEKQRIVLIRQLCGGDELYGVEEPFAPDELVLVQIGGTGMFRGGTGPLDAPLFLQPLIADARVARGKLGELGKDLLSRTVLHLIPHAGREVG